MKGARIVQIFFLIVTLVYLTFFHFANQITVELPLVNRWLPTIPVAYVVALLFLIGWLIGSLTSRLGMWGQGREHKRLVSRVAELEAELARSVPAPIPYSPTAPVPVIPDRDNDAHTTNRHLATA